MTVTWSWDLQAYISAAWTSIKRDVEVYKSPVVAKRGISGSGITDRVASPGSLSCSLDNGESNSAGLLGYYSPEHANMRANFGRDTRVRLKITYSGTDYYKFHGWISDLEPTAGQFKERSSKLYATDYMQRMVRQKLNMLAVQEDQRADQLIGTVIGSMSTAPLATDYGTDNWSMPYALSSEMDERTTVMGAVQKICQTALGYFFIIGDTSGGEKAVFQREESRVTQASAATLSNSMSFMSVKRPTDNIFNKIIGKVHPTRVDTDATTLLYENDSEIYIDGGNTQTFTFRFRDPNNPSVRISAVDVVTPLVADTHYRGSKYQNTTGNDSTSLLSITDTNGGNSSEWEIENTGGFRIYINLINIFGKGIYYYNPVTITQESGDADRETTYDFFYLNNVLKAKGFLSHLLTRISSDKPELESVSFYADENATLMGYAMTLDIGDRVTVAETATGVSGDYTINNVEYAIETNGTLKVTWGLEPVRSTAFFILDQSDLNGTDVLSPF